MLGSCTFQVHEPGVAEGGPGVTTVAVLGLVGAKVGLGDARGVGVQVGMNQVGLGVGCGAILGGRIITMTLQIMLATTTRLRIHR